MPRVAVIICFTLTLLCPVFCLANTGDACSDLSQPMSQNCEAMSFGALVDKADSGIASPRQLLPSLDGLNLPEIVADGYWDRLSSALRHRLRAKSPPDAPRRQALLQTFLF